jgi:hypothetical protein
MAVEKQEFEAADLVALPPPLNLFVNSRGNVSGHMIRFLGGISCWAFWQVDQRRVAA